MEDEVDWDTEDIPEGTSTDHPVLARAPEQTPVAVKVPCTAYDLRNYEQRIGNTLVDPKSYSHSRTIQGKIKTFVYSALRHFDLGLCHATFLTGAECRMGMKCPWRHHPLREEEIKWMLANTQDEHQIHKFLQDVERCWNSPRIPLPGANLEVIRK